MNIKLRSLSYKLLIALFVCALFTSGCKDDMEEEEEEEEEMFENLKVRKNAKDLTPEETTDYVNAILTLKATPSPYSDTLSYYDTFVRFHQMAVEKTKCTKDGVAHMNPAFPAWHRKLLILYEDALSEVSGKPIALPYWDWTDPESTTATFSTTLMGGNGDPSDQFALNNGPFRKDNWQVNLFTISANYKGMNAAPWLTRNFEATIDTTIYKGYPGYEVTLPTTQEVENCLNISTYDMFPWDCSDSSIPNNSFRFCLEGFTEGTCEGPQAIHNIGHDYIAGFWIDQNVFDIKMIPTATYNTFCDSIMRDTVPNNVRVGSMEPLDVSPNDPAFFMHHCNVDKLYADWQAIGDNFEKYEPVSNAPDGYKLNDNMYPYDLPEWQNIPAMAAHGITPASMINYRKLGYEY